MKIENLPIGNLKPFDRNPRIHSDKQVERLAASVQEYGWTNPVLIDKENTIIAGHGRVLAAKSLGMAEVPTIRLEHLSPDQVRAYVVADNALALDADWDEDILARELDELRNAGYDIKLTGLDDDQITELLNGIQGEVDETPAPLPPETPVARKGDIWILGDHRLMCGDSSKPTDLDQLLAGAVIHLANTDPPYNVKVEPRSNNAIAAGLSSFESTHHQKLDVERHPGKAVPTQARLRAKDRPLANDFVSDEEFNRLLDAWFGNIARVLAPGRCFYIWGGYANCSNYPPFLKKHELYFSQAIIWHKQHPVLTRKDFMGDHEWCFYGWKEGAGHKFYGPANISDVWSVKKVNPQSMVHLTEKPVELAVRAMQYSSAQGENVLDLFGGSGSTLMAAEQTGRRAFLMELDELYCDVIIRRFQEATGKPAIHAVTGKSYQASQEACS